MFDGGDGSISSISGSCVGDGVCGDAEGVMEGSCVRYNACYTAERDSGLMVDVTGSCRGKGKGVRVRCSVRWELWWRIRPMPDTCCKSIVHAECVSGLGFWL